MPERMAEEEKRDEAERGAFPPQTLARHRAHVVRHAFWSSLILVILSCALGYAVGAAYEFVTDRPSARMIAVVQMGGAALLLWGTLFVRGWSIQTFGGVTLTERVNQWIFRALYCAGTTLLVASLVWT
jgi:hypothetical protein